MKKMLMMLFILLSVFLSGGTMMTAQDLSVPGNIHNLFYIQEGENRNFFLQDKGINTHILLSSGTRNRLLFNFPRGNSGIALLFEPCRSGAGKLLLEFTASPKPWPKGDVTGITVKIRSNQNQIRIPAVYMDSIRLIRILKNPEALEEALREKEEFARHRNLSVQGYVQPACEVRETAEGTSVFLQCTALDEKHRSEAEILLDKGSRASLEGSAIVLEGAEGLPLAFEVRACVDEAELSALPLKRIVTQETLDFPERLRRIEPVGAGRFEQALRALQFLTCREKLLAGSWQYLTYFGRDTLISIMLLQRCLQSSIYEDALQSVLDRTSESGDVAHEEDIGGQAILRRISLYNADVREGKTAEAGEMLKRLGEPIYDYKMVDDDFLLPIAAWRYCGEGGLSPGSGRNFLEKKNARGETNLLTLLRNFDFCLKKAFLFSRRTTRENLVRIGPSGVGDWRDSRNGLGGGVYPSSVNLYLVPAALSAIRKFMSARLVSQDSFREIAAKNSFREVAAVIKDPSLLDGASHAWSGAAKSFRIKLGPEVLRRRLGEYFSASAVSPEEKKYLLSLPLDGNLLVGDFISGSAAPGAIGDGIIFPALSLNERGEPLAVENSDFGFQLFMGEPSPDEVRSYLKLLRLPYPLGLRSETGIFAANPIFSGEPSLWKNLDRNAYHGTVVWSWQEAMLRLGLLRQYRKYREQPKFRELAEELREIIRMIRKSDLNVSNLVHSELWTWRVEDDRMRPIPFGLEEGAETESNPVQLWSTVSMAVMMEEADLADK
ncbi:MAG: hypothetical protein V2A78_04475 [bacterium]